MKSYFITGLILLLPFALTLFIISLLIRILTSPFEDVVIAVLYYYDLFDRPLLFFSGDQVAHFFSKIFILLGLGAITVGIGFMAEQVFIKKLINWTDDLLLRIPIFNKLYRAAQEVIRTVISPRGQSFSQVVLVPFPYPHVYSFGLTTAVPGQTGHLPIYLPAAPNPTFGLVVVFKPEDIIFIDMKVEEALKYIVSCGMMYPGYTQLQLLK